MSVAAPLGLRPLRAVLALLASLVVPGLLVGAWQVAATREWLDPTFFPAPSRIWDAMWKLWRDGALVDGGMTTVGRAVKGWVIAGSLGVAVGMTLAWWPRVQRAVAPTFEFMRSIPPPVIVPVAVLLLGPREKMEVTIIALAAVWPALINTAVSVRATDPLLIDAARVYRLSRWQQATRIQLPSAMPSILVGLRISLAVSVIVAVVAEMIGSSGGLGTLIVESRSRFRIADVYAIVVVLGVLGLVINAIVQTIENWLTRWQRADQTAP